MSLLRTFLQVAKYGGIRKAAEKLYLTPSAISARIRQLEDEMGAPLLERGKHGSHLTPAGDRLRQHADELLNAWNRLRRNVALPEGAETLLGVGATDSIWQTGLLDTLQQLQEDYPALVLRAEVAPSNALLQSLIDGELDVAILFDPPHVSGLESEFIADLPLMLVASEPGMHVDRITPLRWIQIEWGSSFDAAQLQALGKPMAGMVRMPVGSLALQWLLKWGGVALLPIAMVQDCLDNGELYPVQGAGKVAVPMHLVRSSRGMDAVVQSAIDLLQQRVRALAGEGSASK